MKISFYSGLNNLETDKNNISWYIYIIVLDNILSENVRFIIVFYLFYCKNILLLVSVMIFWAPHPFGPFRIKNYEKFVPETQIN